MRKAVYLLFLFASFVASGLGLNKSEAGDLIHHKRQCVDHVRLGKAVFF